MTNGGLQDTTPPEVPGFSVGRKLGRGSTADVWLVERSGSHQRFALKRFHGRGLDGEDQAVQAVEEDVRREIRILSVLKHPHLVRVHDVIGLSGDGCRGLGILLDFAAGGSLAELIAARGRLTVGETVTVLTPVAQALAFLHAKGFTHADVSPGNVLFSAEGKPLLTDLGIARMVGEPAAAARAGTPGFCDPAPVDSVRVGLQPERDLYSLAAVGWFCLTGEVPPAARDRPPLPLIHPEVPAALAAALESGLHEDRRQRPTAAGFATAVYRSAAPAAVGLSTSVHPSVIPELLTRRRLPGPAPDSLPGKLQTWHRRLGGPRDPEIPEREGRLPRFAIAGLAAAIAGGLIAVAALQAPGAAWEDLLHSEPAPAAPSRLTLSPATPSPATPSPATPDSRTDSVDVREDVQKIPSGVEVQLGSSDPAVAVLGLAWLRSEAFRAGKPVLLERVNIASSAAGAADGRIMADLQAAGLVLPGFTMELRALTVEAGGTDAHTVIGVDSSTTSYQETSTAGEPLADRAAVPSERLQLVLERDDGRWRISNILPG